MAQKNLVRMVTMYDTKGRGQAVVARSAPETPASSQAGAADTAADGRGPRKEHRFRGDVEGLRAVAIGAVLVYHAGVAPLTGGYVGVDVFFVISGFLITGLLLRELEKRGTISLVGFYTRRMRRLLPLTVVVLATVVLLAWLIMSPVQRTTVSGDVIASGLYVINWRLAAQSIDYSAAGSATSPLQHFWSLAVEEQFYIIWPVLLLLVAWWCRRHGGRRLRLWLAVVLGVVAAASLLYSVYLTRTAGDKAYFSTLTRGWELAAGGLLALIPAGRLRSSRRLAGLVGFAGLIAIIGSVIDFTDNTRFPGHAALLPVLGTVAVIAAGTASADALPARLLSLRPVRYVGRISYSWYVWHWPLIVFATVWIGHTPSTKTLVAVVAVSWVPAAITHRLVEDHFRRARAFAPTSRALRLGAVCTATSVVLGVVSLVAVPTIPAASAKQVTGAKELQKTTSPQQSANRLRPTPKDASEDRGIMHDDGCLVAQRDDASPPCVYGDPSSDTTVVLFGDSHAMQYFPALNKIAKKRDWRLVGLTKSACTPAEVKTYNPQLRREYGECDTWRKKTLQRIVKEDPSMVITGQQDVKTVMKSGRRLNKHDSAVALEKGYAATLRTLKKHADTVITLADSPHPPKDIPVCVAKSMDHLTTCAFSERVGERFTPVTKKVSRKVDGVQLLDATPRFCPDATCPAVIGDVLVYRNAGHITATYMRTLTPWLAKQVPSVH